MSETIVETPSTGEPISTADLERMLEESRNRATAAERERDEERTTRRLVEQERDHATTAVKSAAELRFTAEVSATDMALTSFKAAAEHALRSLSLGNGGGGFRRGGRSAGGDCRRCGISPSASRPCSERVGWRRTRSSLQLHRRHLAPRRRDRLGKHSPSMSVISATARRNGWMRDLSSSAMRSIDPGCSAHQRLRKYGVRSRHFRLFPPNGGDTWRGQVGGAANTTSGQSPTVGRLAR